MRVFQIIATVIGLTAVLLVASSTYTPEIIYLDASKDPIRVKPAHIWTQDVPNSEHEEKCIYTNYDCPEQFFFILTNSEDV